MTRRHTSGAHVARSRTEHLTNTDLRTVSSIVWSTQEFYSALRALADALGWSEAEQETWINRIYEDAEHRAQAIFGQAPFAMQYLMQWFNDRYRAHAPLVGNMHMVRFHAIQSFFSNHAEDLEADGWIDSDPEEGVHFEDSLIQALCTIQYRADALKDPSAAIPRLAYDDVIDLAEEFDAGAVQVVEFTRSEWEGDGSEVYEVDYEDNLPPMPMKLVLAALPHFLHLRDMDDSELRALLPGLSERMDMMDDGEEAPPLIQAAMFIWFMREADVEIEVAHGWTHRIITMDRFLTEHSDRLVRDGWMADEGEYHRLDESILRALNLQRYELPRGADEIPLPPYETITGVAQHLPDFAGRGRGETTPKVGRNDPCPCGSGKKAKKCHGTVAQA